MNPPLFSGRFGRKGRRGLAKVKKGEREWGEGNGERGKGKEWGSGQSQKGNVKRKREREEGKGKGTRKGERNKMGEGKRKNGKGKGGNVPFSHKKTFTLSNILRLLHYRVKNIKFFRELIFFFFMSVNYKNTIF